MEMTGEQLIPLPQQSVWEALNNPEILKACIAGCESMERVSDTEYKVTLSAAVGPVKARFNGKLLLTELNPPTSYSLAFEGSGGAAGFGKGGASVRLSPEGSGTRLSYSAKATVGGKLAQIGSRLIDGVAKKMSDDFFVKFNQTLSPAHAAVAAPAAEPHAAAAAHDTGTWLWVIAAGAVVALFGIYSMVTH